MKPSLRVATTVAVALVLCATLASPVFVAAEPAAIIDAQAQTDETDQVIHALGAPAGGSANEAIAKPMPEEVQEEGTWRTLCKGQSMLQGAHVRLDMTSGARSIFVPKGKEAEYSDYMNECPAELADENTDALLGKVDMPLMDAADATDGVETIAPLQAGHPVTDVEQMDIILRSLPEPDEEFKALDRSKLSPEEYEAAVRTIWEHRQAQIRKVMDGLQVSECSRIALDR
jgi:hypothetical protein